MPYVYCAFDASDRLLYIGRAKNWGSRWAGHSAQRPDLFRLVSRLDVEYLSTDTAAAAREAWLIAERQPLWNRRAAMAPDPSFRCERCHTSYADMQDASEMVWHRGRELWSIAGLCNDMSGYGGTPDAPCRGRVVPA